MSDVSAEKRGRPTSTDLLVVIVTPMAAILAAGGVAAGAGMVRLDLLGVALLITAVSAGIGGGILAWVWRRWPEFLPQGVLAAMGMRMMLTLAGILVFLLLRKDAGLQFVLCTVILYIVGLICETVTAVRKLSTGASRASASDGKDC